MSKTTRAKSIPVTEEKSAPAADAFPDFPAGWFVLCRSSEMGSKPFSREMLGTRIVAFRTSGGGLSVMNGNCCHMGADLGLGDVVNDCIRCPFHHWEYEPEGTCARIPAQDDIPIEARQKTYPAIERHGFVYFFNGDSAPFDLPFFPDVDPADFVAGRPFTTDLKCPWFMVGSNAFDMQHFRAAHDRRLKGETEVTSPSPESRQASGTFDVSGDTIRDRITRVMAGNEVTMSITDNCGVMMFVTAKFHRTTSFGMVTLEPLSSTGVRVNVTVFTRRRGGLLGEKLLLPLLLAIRTYFIREFLRDDAMLLNSARYDPRGFIECDQELIGYFRWLQALQVELSSDHQSNQGA